jgi:hypothetical protein
MHRFDLVVSRINEWSADIKLFDCPCNRPKHVWILEWRDSWSENYVIAQYLAVLRELQASWTLGDY